MFDLVRYLTTERDLPESRMEGYDYILAGNGLFKRAQSRHVAVQLALNGTRVAGLPELYRYIHLRAKRVPVCFLEAVLGDARQRSWDTPREAMYHLVRDGGRVRLAYPQQKSTRGRIVYQGGGDPAILCDLHSHHEMESFFSSTDDGDEQGFRFYAVIGNIFTRPVIALRLGVHGDHWRLPAKTLFNGLGPFEEATWKSRDATKWK